MKIYDAVYPNHLSLQQEEAVSALSIKLTRDVAYLEEQHVPHRIVGHQ
jgi:hypothetical protein